MKIGELAQLFQCTVETVRYYEKAGLLPIAQRTQSNYRDYDEVHVERLRFIRNCRALNMTHQEIRTLLTLMADPTGDCSSVNLLLDEHISHVDVRITELSQLKQQLSEIRQSCQTQQKVSDCGILHELSAMESEPRQGKNTHLG